MSFFPSTPCIEDALQNGGKWAWSANHPWQSWRSRYVKLEADFDDRIARYQKRKGITPGNVKTARGTTTQSKAKAAIRVSESGNGKRKLDASDHGSNKKAKLNGDQVRVKESERAAAVNGQADGQAQGRGEGGSAVITIEKGTSNMGEGSRVPSETQAQSARNHVSEMEVGVDKVPKDRAVDGAVIEEDVEVDEVDQLVDEDQADAVGVDHKPDPHAQMYVNSFHVTGLVSWIFYI